MTNLKTLLAATDGSSGKHIRSADWTDLTDMMISAAPLVLEYMRLGHHSECLRCDFDGVDMVGSATYVLNNKACDCGYDALAQALGVSYE
jgi:hypothetical protein